MARAANPRLKLLLASHGRRRVVTAATAASMGALVQLTLERATDSAREDSMVARSTQHVAGPRGLWQSFLLITETKDVTNGTAEQETAGCKLATSLREDKLCKQVYRALRWL